MFRPIKTAVTLRLQPGERLPAHNKNLISFNYGPVSYQFSGGRRWSSSEYVTEVLSTSSLRRAVTSSLTYTLRCYVILSVRDIIYSIQFHFSFREEGDCAVWSFFNCNLSQNNYKVLRNLRLVSLTVRRQLFIT